MVRAWAKHYTQIHKKIAFLVPPLRKIALNFLNFNFINQGMLSDLFAVTLKIIVLSFVRSSGKRPGIFYTAIFLLIFSNTAFAEGSKELNANGGYRAYLLSSDEGNASFPFPTMGTMKVYVKPGESIYVGSSAQGDESGTIN